jgi:limonene-1,2-epoxide hydrolase
MATREVAVTPAEIVDAWLRAFNAGDAGAMVALYAQDATHTSPKLRVSQPATGGRIAGRGAMHEWWASTFERSPGMRYDVITTVADDRAAFIEYMRIKPGEEPLRVAEVFEIRDGKIVRSHVFHG